MSSLTLVQQQNKKKTNESNKITASTPTLVVYSPCPFSWTLPHFLVYHFFFVPIFISVTLVLSCQHPTNILVLVVFWCYNRYSMPNDRARVNNRVTRERMKRCDCVTPTSIDSVASLPPFYPKLLSVAASESPDQHLLL